MTKMAEHATVLKHVKHSAQENPTVKACQLRGPEVAWAGMVLTERVPCHGEGLAPKRLHFRHDRSPSHFVLIPLC